jgi:hypothetical protein
VQTKLFTILFLSFAAAALSEDLKTVNGKEYKDATVTRVDPDGVVVKTKSGSGRFTSPNCQKKFRNAFVMTPKRPRHILRSRPPITPHIKSSRTKRNANNRPPTQKTMLY